MGNENVQQAIKQFDLPDNFVDINRNRLHEECERQPTMMFEVSLQLAAAEHAETEAKNKLLMAKADLSLRVRKNPEDFGLPDGQKLTEDFVKSVLTGAKPITDIEAEITAAEYAVTVYKAAVTALDHRKTMLQQMVALHGQSYFAAVKATPEAPATAAPKAGKPLRRPT